MIHISSKKGIASSMFNRRPRHCYQAGFIVVLLLGMMYLLYINNEVNGKLSTLESKNKRYHAQHQSLSSQLQVVYEDRSRLENTLQKTKNEHQAIKEELQLQKDAHKNIVEDMQKNHKQKYEDVGREHQETKDQLEKLMLEAEDVRKSKEALEDEKHQYLLLIEQHEKEKKNWEEKNQMLQDRNDALSSDQKSNQQLQSDYLSRLRESQSSLNDYEKLKAVMKKAGVDVFKLDHDKFDMMSKEDRMLLFSHFGGSDRHGMMVEQLRIQVKNDAANRQEAMKRQQLQRDERNRMLALQSDQVNMRQNNANLPAQEDGVQSIPSMQQRQAIPNDCMLPLEIGKCSARIESYYFKPETSVCRLFFYSGCMGNENRFNSLDECESKCLGLKPEANQMAHPLSHFQQNLNQPIGYLGDKQQLMLQLGQNVNQPVNGRGLNQPINGHGLNQPKNEHGLNQPVNGHGLNQPINHHSFNQAAIGNQPPNSDENNLQQKSEQKEDEGRLRAGFTVSPEVRQKVPGVVQSMQSNEEANREGTDIKLDNENGEKKVERVQQPKNAPEATHHQSQVIQEKKKVPNAIEHEEARIKDEERRAKEELEQINRKKNENQPDGVKPEKVVANPQDAIKELGKMHKQQEELAREKAKNFEKLAALKAEKGKLNGRIEDENKEEHLVDLDEQKENEPANQMLQPPAVQAVQDNQNMPVLDVPNVKKNSKRNAFDQESLENEDYNNNEIEPREEDEDGVEDNYDLENREDYREEEEKEDADNRDALARREAERHNFM